MRDIKFRAWDNKEQCMFDPYTLTFQKDKGLVIRKHYKSFLLEMDDCILMQYTGLKDKNGKEIYEGDIVKTYYRNNLPHTGEVYFQPTRLNWSVKHSVYTNQDLFVYTRPDCSFEVIGNIYENPELLK